MKTYLIIVKLNYSETTYTNLLAFIKTAPGWAHPFESAWIIQTSATSEVIRDGVRDRINKNDKVLVIEIPTKNWATFDISAEVTDWMKKFI